MNVGKVLSTPGPVTGASKRASIFWALLAMVTYLATIYAIIAWNSWNVIIILLIGPILAMIGAGIQAYQNGSVLFSFLLTFAPVLGVATNLWLGAGAVEFGRHLVVQAFFAGATAHLLGFELSKPRPASKVETWGVIGILVFSGVVFIWIEWPLI